MKRSGIQGFTGDRPGFRLRLHPGYAFSFFIPDKARAAGAIRNLLFG